MLCLGFTKVQADDSGLITEQIKINVVEAGTLCDRIKSDLKYKITSLKLSGKLNIDDILYIREMAGCYYDTKGSKYDGHLEELDLKDASFVSSNKIITVYDGNSSYTASLYNANSVGDYTFGYLPYLRKIILPDNVASIGSCAFRSCSNLISVKLPTGLTSIGAFAFEYCTGLTSLELPTGLTSIDMNAFCWCTNLTSLQLPYNLTLIGNGAFLHCTGLTSLELPSGLTSISAYAFSECSGLTSLKLPSGITSIGYSAFAYCSGLTSLQFPSSLTSINACAFQNCTGLTSLEFPSGLTKIEEGAFSGCSNINSIYAYMPDPLLFDGDGKDFPTCFNENCTLYVPKKSYTAYIVAPGWGDFKTIAKFNPDLIRDWVTKNVAQAGTLSTVIGEDKENITKLKLTGNLNDTDVQYLEEMIREAALQELNLKDALLYTIESLRFCYCKNLTYLVLPDVLQRIEKAAFGGCTGLTTISLPAGLEYMYAAFDDCTGLTSVYANMPTPLQDAFSFYDGVDKSNCILYVSEGSLAAYRQMENTWGLFQHIVEFDSATGLLTLDIQANGDGSLSGLVDAELRGRVKNLKISGQIGNSDFDFINQYLSGNLQNLDLKDANVTDLPYCGLEWCQALTTISLPAGLRSIDKGFLSLCRNLKTIYAYMPDPDALIYWDDFYYGSREWTLYVPKGTKNAYQNSEAWRYCKEIIEMETSGIDSVILNPDAKEVSHFSADGQRLAVPVKGLNIVKYSDGSARKVVVK